MPDGKLTCPATRYLAGSTTRPQVWALNAVGGPDWGGNPPEGPYGLALGPADYPAPFPAVTHDLYALGAKFGRYRRPSIAYMALEADGSGDTSKYSVGATMAFSTNGYGTPTADPFVFRHNRRSGPHAGMLTNIVYLDGHAKSELPDLDLKERKHWDF